MEYIPFVDSWRMRKVASENIMNESYVYNCIYSLVVESATKGLTNCRWYSPRGTICHKDYLARVRRAVEELTAYGYNCRIEHIPPERELMPGRVMVRVAWGEDKEYPLAETEREVLKFIENFAGAKRTFTNGCCYWFAAILRERFGADIYYDDVNNHFVGRINGRFYDATGEVFGIYEPWSELKTKDPAHYDVIVRDCVKKV